MNKEKLKLNLEKKLNRSCTANELINAEKDTGLLCEYLLEKVEELEKRITQLEQYGR